LSEELEAAILILMDQLGRPAFKDELIVETVRVTTIRSVRKVNNAINRLTRQGFLELVDLTFPRYRITAKGRSRVPTVYEVSNE
jgi:hypothetical protein